MLKLKTSENELRKGEKYFNKNIVDRGLLTPILWQPPYVAYILFCKFRPTPFPHTQNPILPSLHFLLLCFFDWVSDCATSDVLFYLMTLWIYKIPSLGTLLGQGTCSVFYATRCQFTEVQHMTWLFASTLILYHTHKQSTQKHNTNRGHYWLTHP